MGCKVCAEILRIERKRATLVPYDRERFPDRFAFVQNVRETQSIALSPHD